MTKKTYTLQEAIRKLEQYCAYQERCHQEVRQKLEALNMIPEAIDVVIVHLLEHNFLNESRFAKTFVRGKFNIKGWGKQRLKLELKRRFISEYNIGAALAEIEETEYLDIFYTISQKKIQSMRETNVLKKRQRFINYFLYRGWESHLVYEMANTIKV
ncbi:regulatory protein RecX [Cognatitamlana onchidii]|uniref:regulatory protein RecX n=1 Tax=Cognatitamlana onchidii TaxID=2562860 RepID=UPI0010A61EC8|nr:regulatory protein RecX [Algibacter onchidii]